MRIDREKVRQLMLRQGFQTFSELAPAVGISRQTLSSWFGGKEFVSGNLNQLCRVLQCTPNDVLAMEDAPKALAPALA